MRKRSPYRRAQTRRWPVAVAVLAGLTAAFLAVAGFAGKWMAENLVAPALNLFAGSTAGAQATASPSFSDARATGAAQTATAAGGWTQQALQAPAVRVTCVQLGAFATQQNATVLADVARRRGGAGLVLQDGDTYRVLAAGYESEAEAGSVRDSLAEQGVSALLYTLACEATGLRVTAQPDRAQTLSGVFDQYQAARVGCLEQAAALDAQTTELDRATQTVRGYADQMQALIASLPARGEDAIASALRDMLEQAKAELLNAAQAQGETAAGTLRHAHLRLTELYVEFSKMLGQIA